MGLPPPRASAHYRGKPMSKKSKATTKSDPVTGETFTVRDGKTYDAEGFEIVGGSGGKEMAIGEVVEGVYGGVVRTMPGRKKGSKVPFYQVGDRALLGSTVLKSRIEDGKITEGDFVRVTRLEDGTAKKGQNAAKIFEVRVKRAS